MPDEPSNFENLLKTLRFRLLFAEFWEMSLKALTRPKIVMPNAEAPSSPKNANSEDFESALCQLCAKLRDSNQPSPKIYSIKHWFTKIPENEKNGEKVHKFITKELSHDAKVIELINAYDKF